MSTSPVTRQDDRGESQTSFTIRAIQYDAYFRGAREWTSGLVPDSVLHEANPYRDEAVA